MELLHSHRWTDRMPDWAAAAVAGFGAGGVLMLLELLWVVTVQPSDPWLSSRMVAAMMMGSSVLDATGYSTTILAVALLVHYVLGVVFGIVLALLISSFRFDSSAPMILLAGTAFGLALYACNFYLMVGAFPWLAAMQGWSTAIGHAVFGMVAAFTYLKLERKDLK
ncbi:hypothetical protein HSX11_07410 [Oxalobacteraceae bacterium]|nr:hypothetical protein [Oxalobacteraceae bacterium]